jgi:hypothetical protein
VGLRSHQRENPLQGWNTSAAITLLADFSCLRNPLLKNHLRHPAAPIPPPMVRFLPASTDNQSAGKLRLGFRPYTAALPAQSAPVFDNRIPRRTPPSTVSRAIRPTGSPVGRRKAASDAAHKRLR